MHLVQKEGQCPPHLRPGNETTWINGDGSAPALCAHQARWSIRDDVAAWVSERLSIACASAGGLHAQDCITAVVLPPSSSTYASRHIPIRAAIVCPYLSDKISGTCRICVQLYSAKRISSFFSRPYLVIFYTITQERQPRHRTPYTFLRKFIDGGWLVI